MQNEFRNTLENNEGNIEINNYEEVLKFLDKLTTIENNNGNIQITIQNNTFFNRSSGFILGYNYGEVRDNIVRDIG